MYRFIRNKNKKKCLNRNYILLSDAYVRNGGAFSTIPPFIYSSLSSDSTQPAAAAAASASFM